MPLPTLACTISNTGITAPSFQDIITSITQSMQAIFGADIVVDPSSQDGQMIAMWAAMINDGNNADIASYNNFVPTFATGVGLSALVKINGIQRNTPSASTANVTITGTVGTVISGGVVQDVNNNFWNLPTTVTIPSGGTISVVASAQVLGALTAPANTINKIATPVFGWTGVTNPADAVPGAAVESDALLRQRQAVAVTGPALTPLGAIATAVGNVPGVGKFFVYENQGAAVDANGVQGHSIAVIAQGGSSTAIAQAIQSKKSPGTGTVGTTSVTVTDQAGIPVTINFYVLVFDQVFVTLNIHALPGYTTAINTTIINNMITAISNLPVGGIVYANWLINAAQSAGLSFAVESLQFGLAPSPTNTADLVIAFNHAANLLAGNVVINLV